ncbi:hypothetical protein BDZ89DRAFT_1131695 [Hymenopellis radicata]|nr:hypothetical protein BDZ89DRAFT_1131695 [Hymenopellis radicata]
MMNCIAATTAAFRLAPSHVNWTESHERALAKDYPFTDIGSETPDMYVQRTYLQFLWLPESIMPLSLLIPSLLRVNVASTSTGPHPLPALLEPILLTGRVASDKYRVELPQLIADGGGAEEIEELMMWYALSYEKNDNAECQSRAGTNERTEELLKDDRWRERWFERMERRELAVQLLLHMIILTLPGLPETSSPKKRKRSSKNDATNQDKLSKETVEDRIEVYMDKLSTWQLVKDLEEMSSHTNKNEDEHDWVQKFLSQVVEPHFKQSLPEHCSVLHFKLFPQAHSFFSDDEDSESTRHSSSPVPESQARSHSRSRQPPKKRAKTTDAARHNSPALDAISTKDLARSRSRSLSLALVQERAESLGAIKKKRALTREVSMSRSFKGKPKPEEDSQPLKRAPSILRPQVVKEGKG